MPKMRETVIIPWLETGECLEAGQSIEGAFVFLDEG